ncbi:HalOD1 output domain-containing protein [Natronorubrum sp. A-ect3]|uniref:HalOD1 output domain-containing protein n=1 Tax=Natronorubrum sp. A-ect3 TaxID=3242698 RepID=UPI00359E5E69
MPEHESPEANTSPSLRVIEAVADADDIDPASLEPPLYDVVDTNALDRLFEPTTSGPTTRRGRVSFQYRGHEITVSASGRVDLE